VRLLLDTHVFLWWMSDDPRLTQRARRAIADQRNEVLFSVASAWEIALKANSGRLETDDPGRLIGDGLRDGNMAVIAITLDHVQRVLTLPKVHSDPFDRLLVAQALSEGAILVTGDQTLAKYPVPIRW